MVTWGDPRSHGYTGPQPAGRESGGWLAGVAASLFGVSVGLQTNDPDLAEELDAALPFGAAPCSFSEVERIHSLVRVPDLFGGGSPGFALYYGAQLRQESTQLERALQWAEQELMIAIGEDAVDRVIVHAAVVGWRNRAILLPGRSTVGKTTLALALVGLGAQYFSDEYAVIDASGRVYPYARMPVVRERSSAVKLSVEVDTPQAPIRPCLVVSATYIPGARWEPRLESAGHATLLLLSNAFGAGTPSRVLTPLIRAAESVRALVGIRGDAQDAARNILQYADMLLGAVASR